jgi:hypothetical protein
VTTFLRKVLQGIFQVAGDHPSIGQAAPYQAVMAKNPWQAIFLLNHIKERKMGGLLNATGLRAQPFYEQSSWAAWWQGLRVLAHHFKKVKRKGFKPSEFSKQCLRMKESVARLGALTPHQLHVDHGSLARRFGAILGEVWEWTWQPLCENGRELDHGFPWQSWRPFFAPQVRRVLDEVLPAEWEYIEPLLIVDFDRLCNLESWDSQEQVVSLEWRVVSSDLTSHVVPISFRYPHSLHSEKNYHKTATLQAMYAFQKMMCDLAEQYKETDLFVASIGSWDLEVTERMVLPPRVFDLFGNVERCDYEISRLENSLPLALKSYGVTSHWIPEESFCSSHDGAGTINQIDAQEQLHSLWLTASTRPLFIYKDPIAMEISNYRDQRVFLERISDRWWMCDTSSFAHRDYYKIYGLRREALWAYQSNGQWFLHGVFA